MPIEFLKIGIMFVRDLIAKAEDQALVRSLVALARELELKTVAEGVEDKDTLAAVRRYGVDLAQGYVIGRPAPVRLGDRAAWVK